MCQLTVGVLCLIRTFLIFPLGLSAGQFRVPSDTEISAKASRPLFTIKITNNENIADVYTDHHKKPDIIDARGMAHGYMHVNSGRHDRDDVAYSSDSYYDESKNAYDHDYASGHSDGGNGASYGDYENQPNDYSLATSPHGYSDKKTPNQLQVLQALLDTLKGVHKMRGQQGYEQTRGHSHHGGSNHGYLNSNTAHHGNQNSYASGNSADLLSVYGYQSDDYRYQPQYQANPGYQGQGYHGSVSGGGGNDYQDVQGPYQSTLHDYSHQSQASGSKYHSFSNGYQTTPSATGAGQKYTLSLGGYQMGGYGGSGTGYTAAQTKPRLSYGSVQPARKVYVPVHHSQPAREYKVVKDRARLSGDGKKMAAKYLLQKAYQLLKSGPEDSSAPATRATGSTCGGKVQIMANYGDPHTYLVCEHGKWKPMPCAPGTLFCSHKKVCCLRDPFYKKKSKTKKRLSYNAYEQGGYGNHKPPPVSDPGYAYRRHSGIRAGLLRNAAGYSNMKMFQKSGPDDNEEVRADVELLTQMMDVKNSSYTFAEGGESSTDDSDSDSVEKSTMVSPLGTLMKLNKAFKRAKDDTLLPKVTYGGSGDSALKRIILGFPIDKILKSFTGSSEGKAEPGQTIRQLPFQQLMSLAKKVT